MITIIAARSKNGVIGKNGKIPWKLPIDLERFRSITLTHSIIMGRHTYESLPKRPLPGRENIVVTRNKDYEAPGCIVMHSLVYAIGIASKPEIFIIGGQSLYEEGVTIADQIFLTEVDVVCDGDAFFPEVSLEIWEEDFRMPDHPTPNQPNSEFVLYKKKTQKPPTL